MVWSEPASHTQPGPVFGLGGPNPVRTVSSRDMGSYSQFALQEIGWGSVVALENRAQGDAIFNVEATNTVAFNPVLNYPNLVRTQRLIVNQGH